VLSEQHTIQQLWTLSLVLWGFFLSAGVELLKPYDQDLLWCLYYLDFNDRNRVGDGSEKNTL